MTSSQCRAPGVRLAGWLLLGLAATAGAQTQYKLVAPDGRVTYTDRPPVTADQGRVVTINGRNAPASAEPDLPFELRQAATRYPVTLYVTPGNACEPCESGRAMLKKRGIPYAERLVANSEDTEALEKLSGSREAPTLTIGAQVVRGYSPELWTSYLDAAGYPRESKLPNNYTQKPPTPVVERPPLASAKPAVPAAPPPPPALPPATTGTIRF